MASAATTFDLLQKKDFLNTSVEYKGGERNSMTATDYLMGLQEASDGTKIEGESKPDSSAVAAADALCQASPAKTAFWDVDTVRDDSKSKLLKTYEAQRQVLELLANDITEATAGCELQLRQQSRATAETEKRLVDVSHFHRDCLWGRCSLSPHLASLLPQVGNGFTGGHLVFHPSQRLYRRGDRYAWTHQFWNNCVTGARIRREFNFVPLVFWHSHWA